MVETIEAGADEVRRWEDVETIATAIRIGYPVNWPKALPGIRDTGGTAVAVTDEEITDAQRALAGEGVGVDGPWTVNSGNRSTTTDSPPARIDCRDSVARGFIVLP